MCYDLELDGCDEMHFCYHCGAQLEAAEQDADGKVVCRCCGYENNLMEETYLSYLYDEMLSGYDENEKSEVFDSYDS